MQKKEIIACSPNLLMIYTNNCAIVSIAKNILPHSGKRIKPYFAIGPYYNSQLLQTQALA
jgi:hypothetical protein